MHEVAEATAAPSRTSQELSYGEAVNAALRRCLEEVPESLLYGEDIAQAGGVFGATRRLQRDFGDRVFDTPISESAIIGSAVGAAMLGRRPIVEIMFIDFTLVAFDQIVNQLANVRYISRGESSAPVVIRTTQASAAGACAQHGQNLEALFLHVPGIRVCIPNTPQDVYDCLIASMYSDDPVLVIENRTLYASEKATVHLDGRPEMGGSRLRATGDAATIVTWGNATARVLEATQQLRNGGISVEVIETPWLNPFPIDDVIRSVRRTGGLAVIHEANVTGGFGAEVVARVAESGVDLRRAPLRIGAPDIRLPAAVPLVRGLLPNADEIAASLRTWLA